MILTAQQLSNLDEESFREFLEHEAPEGYHLEYKIDFPGKSEQDRKRKFLRSITGFANAAGGHLILGVAEPNSVDSLDDRLQGIDRGQEHAHRYERIAASSVEPRIPGLRFEVVLLRTGRQVILVNVPPSVSKPHMVILEGKREFFIRHSESTVPMSTHEIREAVFASASSGVRAREYLKRFEQDAEVHVVREKHALLMQAMPLVPPDRPWPVLNSEMKNVLRGDRGSSHFSTACAPAPTLRRY